MANCNKCGALNDATSEFCQNCGASMRTATRPPQAQPALQKGLLGKIERTVYFRVARGFSWFVLVFSLLGFVGAGFIAAIGASEYLKGEATVSKDDVMLAIAVRKARRTAGTNADATQEIKLDPKAEGELTQVVAEIFNLLSKEDREKVGGKESFRRQMLEMASEVKGTGSANQQIEYLQEVKKVVNGVSPDSERLEAIGIFSQLKMKSREQAASGKAAAHIQLMYSAAAVLSFAALITGVSMVLVLLAIERNTRKLEGAP